MAVALLGKCVALLGLVVLLYATCYGFRIRDVVPQTHHPTVCIPAHGRACPTDRTVTTEGPMYSARKWHEGTVPRTIVGGRKPPAETTSDVGTERIQIEKFAAHSRDRGATGSMPKSSKIESDEVDDDEEEEETGVEVEGVEEDEESVGDSERNQADGKTDEDEEEESASETELSDQDAEEKKVKKKFPADDNDDKSEDTDEDADEAEDADEEEEDEDKDKDDDKKSFKKDSEKEIKTTKIVKSIKYSKSKANDEDDDDDDKEEDDKEEKQKIVKLDQRKVIELLQKQFSVSHKKQEKDKDDVEDKEPDVKETTPAPRKLEKVRLADKDRTRTATLPSKRDVEKSEQDDKRPADVAKPAVESVKETIESTKKTESIESTKESVDSTKKSIESAKKQTDAAKKVESVKAAPKAEVPEAATKVDEKSKTRVKPETSTPAPKIKEQAKQPEKADVKKVVTKPTSRSSKEVSQAEKQETKPKTTKHTDASITLSEVNDAILRVPTFVPNFTNVENSECQQHGKIFLRQLRGYKLWALQMLDSSAKIPSGLLRGNVNQLGDYDQCLGVLAHVKVDEKTIRIQGKYCLATVDLHASHSDMRLPVNLMQARAFIRGNMHDPGHFIPKFTTFNWALCLPAACSAEDAERALESTLKDYNGTVGIKFTVDVDPNMCYVKQKSQTYSKETIGVLYFYAMIVCLVIVATVRDYFVETRGKGNYSERIIMSFSLRRTIKALLKEATDAADITCIYGIRALATIVLYVAHQLIIISRMPFSNRTSLTEIANSPASSILRVSLVYTDAFLLLSGVLTAYNMARELKTRGEIRWFCRFVARFIRLSPALLAVIFWYAFVMEHVGTGPQWNSVVTANAELCKCNAWTNLLYVQNFFPFEEMCATHTYQLALDMQLSLLAPIIVFFLQYKLIIGILLMIFFILLSATLRYIATMNNYLSLVIYHGISLRRLYKTANLTYALPLHRATPYIFGVGLGVLLHYTGRNVRIHRVLVILGWLIASALGSWSLFSPWRQARRDYVYDAEEATHYAVIGPVLWAAALCWSIFACFTGHGGGVNRFLSSYWLVILSRISYAVYLTQFAVFFYNVGTTRFSTEFQPHRAIDLLEVAIVIAASVVLTLLFDLPMQEVKSVIMESTDMTVEVSEEKKTRASEAKSVESAETAKIEQANVFEDDEIASTGWDWQKDIAHGVTTLEGHDTEEEIADVPTLKKMNGRRMSFIESVRDSEEVSSKDRAKPAARKPSRDTESYTDRKIGMNSQRYVTDDSEEEAIEFLRSQREHDEAAVAQRNRRSLSRTKDNKRPSSRNSESEEEWQRRKKIEDDSRQFRKSESRGRTSAKEADDNRSWEFVGKEGSSAREQHESKPLLVRSVDVARRTFSSESEEEPLAQEKTKPVRVSSSDARTSDEEEWEHELRIRRKQFMEKLIVQQGESLVEGESEGSAESLARRSSAEGRIALLRDISGEDNMDSWTVSVGPRIALLGSSQEPSEPEEDGIYMRRREYREQGPPSREESLSEEESSQDTSRRQSYTSGSQKTSLEEEDDVNNYNFMLTKESKRESLQDLSQLSQEDLASAGWNVVKKEGDLSVKPTSTGLFKRESIVKSQASEEDPEYLLPERPKLVQQEREHPFKKAWQMQKSRSEEEGSSAYTIKDSKEQQSEAKTKEPPIKRESSGEQSEDIESFADDESVEPTVVLRGRSTDTEDTRTSSTRSGTDETDSISTECSRATHERDHRQSSKSETDEDSAKFNWSGEEKEEATEDEIYEAGRRGKSEEADWDWEREET
ncbi:PREDICTED: uncharacterized protein LOC105452989 [Wasmannia auropunctata]|uniref:uncharacterized protein LOC105452989 n=1 Tax=Wasmannia auropunctata TaxID=64793 RepID=UPI0005ED79D6|nr:PREDICTED: uncharacterized protein LOC105452989 [Wasmannia auropunctata]XP_011692911.1 PREDICTED: uncharacterized protein LOC105452989 [Wasmannia auropunctata]